MTVEIILKRSLALMVLRVWAGMIMDWPVSKLWESSSIKISARPSIIWINVSNGDIFSVRFSPESKDTAVTLPVVFFMIVFMTTALGTYSIISTMIKTFDFSISVSVFSIDKILNNEALSGFLSFSLRDRLKLGDFYG